MRRIAKRKQADTRRANEQRAAFVREVHVCMLCRERRAEVTHEIARGASRGLAIFHRCCWLAVCERCHGEIHRTNMTLAEQLSVKQSRDPEHYDRSAVLKIMGRADTAVTEEEVEHARRL